MSFESDVVAQLPVLRRYARALTGNATWADDLVQDTAERALNKRLLWRSGTNLKAWLFAILRNLYIDKLRTQREILSDDDAAYLTYEVPQDRVDWLFLRYVQRALYILPVDQREVMFLSGLKELPYDRKSTRRNSSH